MYTNKTTQKMVAAKHVECLTHLESVFQDLKVRLDEISSSLNKLRFEIVECQSATLQQIGELNEDFDL